MNKEEEYQIHDGSSELTEESRTTLIRDGSVLLFILLAIFTLIAYLSL